MNDVCKTIKGSAWSDRVPDYWGRDKLHSADVKPDTEPDWTTALVVRDRDDSLWVRLGGGMWSIPGFGDPRGFTYWPTTETVQQYGPLTVVIDANGRNVEAQEMSERDDRRYAELSDQAYRCHLAWKSARQRARRSHLEAEKLRAEAVEFADEWEPLRNQLNEAVRAREIAQRDLRIAQRTISRLGDENARLQAQTGDGR